MSTERPVASVSLDLDNQWSYMKTHGDSGWEDFPSYLDVLVPHALAVLEELDLRITFFVVGQDAALDRNREALGRIGASDHEVGNHSFHHEQWIQMAPRERVDRELREAGEAIARATGREPRGYRAPGFAWSEAQLDVLERAGYLYDASTLPTYLGPLARAYYFRSTELTPEQKEERKELFGGFEEGLRPVKPYRWSLGADRTLLEIPVTTIPGIKTPFHLSYLLYLSRFSFGLMAAYLATALRLCRLTGTEPSFLLHPLDVLGGEQVPELAFFPGMDLDAERKLRVLRHAIDRLRRHFDLVPMGEHARRIGSRELALRSPRARPMLGEATS